MCGRFAYFQTDDFDERFQIPPQKSVPIGSSYNVAPGQQIPVVLQRDGERTVEGMRWGFVPPWAKDTKLGYKLINTRAETMFEKPMWKRAALGSRCIIPACGFYEWQKTVGSRVKHAYYIHPTDQKLTSFAGVWGWWRNADGEKIGTVAIVTTTPNSIMMPIHDRMPVMLEPTSETVWLNPKTPQIVLESVLHAYADGDLEAYAVAEAVNSPRVNGPFLLDRLA